MESLPSRSSIDSCTRPPLLRTIGYFAAIALPMTACLALYFSRLTSPFLFTGFPFQVMVAICQVLWVPTIFWAAMTLVGFLRFGAPRDRRPGPDWKWDPEITLIVAYVSRGNQQEALLRSTSATQAVLDELGVRYAIEIVTDTQIVPGKKIATTKGDVFYEVVPEGYQTSKNTRYKARALQYLLEQRLRRMPDLSGEDRVWILHLDEESLITPEAVWGIRRFIDQYDLRTTPGAIGQGEILYNAGRYGQDPLIELIDAVRTGDDLGRFRLQFAGLHKAVFGMHGSFILTPARFEREITWDVGGPGSITEDAYFALIAMERGIRFDWIEGFIREQSPFSVRDLIQQRRRWFCGLRLVASDPNLSRWTTLTLKLSLLFWQISSAGTVLALVSFAGNVALSGALFPKWTALVLTICGGVYAGMYAVGAYRNCVHSSLPARHQALNVALSLVGWAFLFPAIVESSAIMYATFRPVHYFHIVAKETAA